MVKYPFDQIIQLNQTLKLMNFISPEISRYQEQIARIYETLDPIVLKVQQQNLVIANYMTPLVAEIQSIQKYISPIIGIIAEQQAYMQNALMQSEAFQYIEKLHLSIEKTLESPYIDQAVSDPTNKINVLNKVVSDVTHLVNENNVDTEKINDITQINYKVVEIKTIDWINLTLQIVAILLTVIVSYPSLKDNVSLILQDLSSVFQTEIQSISDTKKPVD